MSDDEDDCVSITPSSEAGGSSSASSANRKRKCENGSVFRGWHFQLTIKSDLHLSGGTSVVEKETRLREYLSTRTGNTRPTSVTGVVVFCDRSMFSKPPDSDGLVSIEVFGFVQASHAKPHSTMNKWIDSATWKPVPGGLTSDPDYLSNMRRFQDPDDEWTRLLVFGSIGANNKGRAAEKEARKVGWLLARKIDSSSS